MISPDDSCSLCPLCSGRTNIVRPSGDLSSKVVFVGEAPGENEDLKGVPFVGRAGRILDEALSVAGIDRSSVMITNTVKCRPPGNRDPTEEEMAACRRYLISELEGRALVVGLGRSSCRDLMGYKGKIRDVVNVPVDINVGDVPIRFLPAYHPMACIYSKDAYASLVLTMEIVRGYMR